MKGKFQMTYDFQSLSDIQRDVLISIHSQNYDLFSKTIEKIPDLNAPFFEGKTLLQMTAKHPFTAGLRLLLEKNCDPNNHSEWSQSPLGYAVNSNNYPAVKMLLDHGANPNVRFKYQTEFDRNQAFSKYLCTLSAVIILRENYYFGKVEDRKKADKVVKYLRYRDIHPKYFWIFKTPRCVGWLVYKIVNLKKKLFRK
jgi:ankyrin repeat protein